MLDFTKVLMLIYNFITFMTTYYVYVIMFTSKARNILLARFGRG
jgi:hypothetical protein